MNEKLERVESSLIAQCACDREDSCHRVLRKMVAARVRALGTAAYEELLRDAERHDRHSATERRARQTKIDDFRQREESDDPG